MKLFLHNLFAALDVPSMLLLEILIHVSALLAVVDVAFRLVGTLLGFSKRSISECQNDAPRPRALIILMDNKNFTWGWSNGANDND